jgi:hypothetical protein
MVKKVVQQGRSHLDARSVLPVREHDKMARTPLAPFFIIPFRRIDHFPKAKPYWNTHALPKIPFDHDQER